MIEQHISNFHVVFPAEFVKIYAKGNQDRIERLNIMKTQQTLTKNQIKNTVKESDVKNRTQTLEFKRSN